MRNSVNRIVNCETANLNKTIGAAVRQIDNIKLLQKEVGLENLPDKLREVAEIRLAHPDMNLKEVGEPAEGNGQQVRGEPPAAQNRRAWRKKFAGAKAVLLVCSTLCMI